MTGFADLDELVLSCRNADAKTLISEAVTAYKAGAYRAAIVATWIAVAYDFISKLRELALTGDKRAEQELERFEKARTSGDVVSALKFERDLLELARDGFELISPLEYTDLARLQEDRNRCAHPTMNSSEETYIPSAELARSHIRTAVTTMLQRPPVQGKAALDRLLREVESPYFPQETLKAVTVLRHGPLGRPRDSLVRNFVLAVTKSLVFEDHEYAQFARKAAALNGVRKLNSHIVELTLSERLPDIFRSIPHDHLNRAVRYLWRVSDNWHFLPDDVQQILVGYVIAMPSDHFGDIDEALGVEPLRRAAEKRVAQASQEEVFGFPGFFLDDKPVNDRRIALYLYSRSFDQANTMGKDLANHVRPFTEDQVRRLIAGAAANAQVRDSFELATVVNALRNVRVISEALLREILAEHELEELLR